MYTSDPNRYKNTNKNQNIAPGSNVINLLHPGFHNSALGIHSNVSKPSDNKSNNPNQPDRIKNYESHRRVNSNNNKNNNDDDNNSSSDDLSTVLAKVTAKRNKKLQRDLTYSVQNPLALGIKQLTMTNASRAARYEKAILLRAKKPRTTTMQQILRDDSLLEWDHPLLTITIKEMLQYQADQYKASNQLLLAQKLLNDMEDLLVMLAED